MREFFFEYSMSLTSFIKPSPIPIFGILFLVNYDSVTVGTGTKLYTKKGSFYLR